MIAALRKVRFIRLDSASQASRSSPIMSSSKSRASEILPAAIISDEVAHRPDHQRIFRGDEAQRLHAPSAPAAASAACPASGAPGGPRRDSRPCSACRRAGKSRPASRSACGTTDLKRCSDSQSLHLRRQMPSRISDRPASRAPVRPDRSRAETCRPGRTESSARARRRAWPARRTRRGLRSAAPRPRRGRCRPTDSWLRNHSSISPSTRPPTTTRLPSRRFTLASRTFSISSSTMVPMFSR